MPQLGPYIVVHDSVGNEILGQLLKRYRTIRKMSAKTLAETVGIHPSFVRGIERGVQAPSLETAKKLTTVIIPSINHEWFNNQDYDLSIQDPDNENDILFQFKTQVKGQNSRNKSDQRTDGCWVSYHSDMSDFVIFNSEINALRHAVSNTMQVAHIQWGQGRTDILKGNS